jgi:hypothetical protein
MKFVTAMFSEESDVSCMRVMCFIALLTAGYLAVTGHDTSVLAFLGAAFGGKVTQKFVEKK